MKKVISVLLCVIMILSCVPFAVYAAGGTELTSAVLADLGYDLSGSNAGNYTVSSGRTVLVPADKTLTVGVGSRLEIYGKLDTLGKVVSKGGDIIVKCYYDNVQMKWNHGMVTVPENVYEIIAGENHIFAEIVVNGLPDIYADGMHYVSQAVWSKSENGYAYEDINIENWQNIWSGLAMITRTGSDAVVIGSVPLNQYFYFRMKLLGENGEDKYDTSRALKFTFNSEAIDCNQSTYKVYVDCAGVIDFAGDRVWENEEKYLKRERIFLPSGAGYSVFGVNGEASAYDSTVNIPYGREFTFRLDIDKAYSDSDYKVYCVNSYKWDDSRYEGTMDEIAGPSSRWFNDTLSVVEFKDGDVASGFYRDEYGVYHISGEYMKRDCTVYVSGVVKNSTISLAGKIVELLKNIFVTIKSIFEQLARSLGRNNIA